MRTALLALTTAFTVSAFAADTYVQGYYKRDGTYIAPHHQATRDDKLYNNYSSQDQINPYTGTYGTKRNEYSSPPAYQKSSPLYTPQFTPQSNYNYGYQEPKRKTNPYGW